ncbi:hypothetical protein FVE85_8728 [Porphyridium purpureum]|uniref:Uncharacterized protein n=1 Tax=Porphyridium purpureum TaxID=35688 RepID=A0A5J4YR63_PORPP|nr:hypothetical protein FVE85_8728 [Porphyridium purpureum]|eukprot:POR1446..scf296_7
MCRGRCRPIVAMMSQHVHTESMPEPVTAQAPKSQPRDIYEQRRASAESSDTPPIKTNACMYELKFRCLEQLPKSLLDLDSPTKRVKNFVPSLPAIPEESEVEESAENAASEYAWRWSARSVPTSAHFTLSKANSTQS